MQNEDKKGITVKVRTSLHAEVKEYLEENGITMSEFVETALQDKLHPKNQKSEEKEMENMRTIAFQVPESLFQRIKEYLQRNNVSQRQFMIGLAEKELNREQAVRETETPCNEAIEEPTAGGQETPAEREFEGVESTRGDGDEVADEEGIECEEESEEESEGESAYGEKDHKERESGLAESIDENEPEGMSMSM